MPSASILEHEAREFRHPLLQPIELDPTKPLSPDEAAVLAVLINPALRAERDRAGVAAAQLISAGLLPNPVLNASLGVLTGGPGTSNAFGIGPSWEVTSLVTHGVKVQAARESLSQVRLDVAWAEWQAAEAAKSSVYAVSAVERELRQARQMEQLLEQNLQLIQRAYDRHDRTVQQLSAARTARDTARASTLSLEQQYERATMDLLRALGLPADATVDVRRDVRLPTRLQVPSKDELLGGLAQRRLDLVALRHGYQSQELKVRQAILAQFPRIDLGVSPARDNTDVHSINFSVGIPLPIFDRNQGAIALQRATRRRLYDEYVDRVFIARHDVVTLLKDISALAPQIAAAQDAVPSLERLVETYRNAVDRGNADVLNYYSAWQSLDQKRIDILRWQGQLAADRIALEVASGELLPQSQADVAASPQGTQ